MNVMQLHNFCFSTIFFTFFPFILFFHCYLLFLHTCICFFLFLLIHVRKLHDFCFSTVFFTFFHLSYSLVVICFCYIRVCCCFVCCCCLVYVTRCNTVILVFHSFLQFFFYLFHSYITESYHIVTFLKSQCRQLFFIKTTLSHDES